MKDMSPRERVLTALNRKEPDRVPKDAWWTPPVLERFRQKTGADNPADYFGFETRGVGIKPSKKATDFSKYLLKLPEDAIVDEWGVGHIRGSMYHFTKMVHPMAKLKSVDEIEKYPFPDLIAEYRYIDLEKDIKRLKDRGYFVQGGVGPMLFETAWYLRGMDNLFVDFSQNPEFATMLLDKIAAIRCEQFARCAGTGVDQVTCGDDVGMQDTMIMSPDMWRKWLKPRFAKIIKSAHKVNPNVRIFYHSDGYIEPIIPDLIEIGVDVLNPVQPECMDLVKIKKQYGNKLSFWGVGSAHTMAFGKPKDIEKEVIQIIQTVGKGGGLVIMPSTDLEPDMPWENIMAFFNAVEKYGRYKVNY